jgi:hypothetical protein
LASLDRKAATERIVAVLQPYLGATMAEASTRAHCEKLGIVGEALTSEQLESLLGKLASGLSVFVGREQSVKVMDEIRSSLRAGGAS